MTIWRYARHDLDGKQLDPNKRKSEMSSIVRIAPASGCGDTHQLRSHETLKRTPSTDLWRLLIKPNIKWNPLNTYSSSLRRCDQSFRVIQDLPMGSLHEQGSLALLKTYHRKAFAMHARKPGWVQRLLSTLHESGPRNTALSRYDGSHPSEGFVF